MAVTAIMGVQWGDEGKGKMVDYLAAEADLVIRYQGGANAGHTIINGHGTFKLRLVPSGICHAGTRNLIGPGAVIDPAALLAELQELAGRGLNTGNVLLAERATLVMPWHLTLDRLEEAARGALALGTTLCGVGPAFTAKAARQALKVADLADKDWLAGRVRWALRAVNPVLVQLYGQPAFDAEAVVEQYWTFAAALRERIVDSHAVVREALRQNQTILLEGQLGAMKDPDWGAYPYVTSSSPLAGAAAVGAGVPPWTIGRVVGVTKAYTTAVGEGPLPAEGDADLAQWLRTAGGEFGVVTGRPRRCGWFDAVATRFGCEVAGVTELALTKLDVLDGLPELKLCVGYRVAGRVLHTVPTLRQLQQVEPVWETLPGWNQPTRAVRQRDDLPRNALRYLERIEQLVGVPIRLLSVGPERHETVRLRT